MQYTTPQDALIFTAFFIVLYIVFRTAWRKGYRQGVIKAETILKETQEKNT